MSVASGDRGFGFFGLRALALDQLLDPVAAHRVIDRGPGPARPFDLGGVVIVERSVPFLAAASRRLVELGVAIGAAHHPEAGLAALLLDAEPGIGVIDRLPGPLLPGGLGRGIVLERADPLFLAAFGHAVEVGVLVGATDDPETLHDPLSRLAQTVRSIGSILRALLHRRGF